VDRVEIVEHVGVGRGFRCDRCNAKPRSLGGGPSERQQMGIDF
jgi:hypothetical protein